MLPSHEEIFRGAHECSFAGGKGGGRGRRPGKREISRSLAQKRSNVITRMLSVENTIRYASQHAVKSAKVKGGQVSELTSVNIARARFRKRT